MKTRNRILGILLVTIMVLAIVPFSAMTVFADSGYTVTLYANDGQGTQEQIENVSGLYVLPECSFTAPPEMTFLAWAIGSQSGEQKQPGAAINITEDTLIVAIWTESASIYETRPDGGVTSVNGTFDIRYRLTLQPETMFLEFYNDYQGIWAEKYMLATIPAYEGALTHFSVPTIHKDSEETIKFRLCASKNGIDYYSNEFVVKYTNNRFTSEPNDTMLSPGAEYDVTYAMSFTPSDVSLEFKDGNTWKRYSNATATGVSISGGDGEQTLLFRIKAIADGEAYYSREFTVRWANITEVSTFNELLNAVNSDKTYIKLTNDIEDIVPNDELPTKHRLVFDGGVDSILDLNGYELKVLNHSNEFFSGDFALIEVSNDSSLEIKDGDIFFDNYFAKADRQSKGNVAVKDSSTFVATHVNMKNAYTGTVVYAGGTSTVTLDGGEYTVQNGFALYLEAQAALTLDGGVYIHTVMGDSTSTAHVDGYGALYSESTGELTINNAFFKSGVQINSSQADAFSIATHEVTINGKVLTEDIFVGTSYEANQQNKEYFWYSYSQWALYKTENSLFSNPIRVISYEKKYPITIESGVAMFGGVPVTEASYGQEITVVANTPEEGMEFVRWGASGGVLTDDYNASTTFTMPASPVNLTAYYGNESVKSVNATVGEIIPGEKAYDTEITLENGVILQDFEWREESYFMGEDDIFKAGKTYTLKILVYPPNEHKFDNSVTATVNGNSATVNGNTQYVYIDYTFTATPSAGFSIVYDINNSQLGVGGKLVLDTALMATQSAEFKAALDADKVTYQWYRNGEAVEGATNAVYNFTAQDAEGRFYVIVTADGKTNYGHNVSCSSNLYQIYLNAGDIIAGGKAPQITAATPGISIDVDTMVIYEILGENSYSNPKNVANAILVPGKNYLLVGKIIAQDGISVANGANVYVNDEMMQDKLDTGRFFYEFSVPEADYPVYYTENGEIGIGVTLTVDIEKMCNESGTFKNAYDKANPTYQTVFYQWYKNGEAINGATKDSYTVKSTDKNSLIHCQVTLVDGKFGIGEQYVITNVITVLNVQMPYPKAGETRIEKSDVSVDGATVSGIMWWPKETQVEMQGYDKYVEGVVYEVYILFSPKDTFVFADQANRTVYIYGTEATYNSGYAYIGEVTAIHTHQYSDEVWAYDDEGGHWMPCIVPSCPDPNEDYVGYVFHWGGDATCHTAGVCGQCGAEYYAEHDFSVPDYQYLDDMKCATYCANCDKIASWSYHTGGVSDCQHKSVCEICNHEYGNLAPCSGGVATHTSKAICATCGNEYGEVLQDECSGVLESGQGATCTVDGWKDYYRCECGKYYEDANCQTPINDLAAWKVGDGKITAAHTGTPEWTKTSATHEKKYTCCGEAVVEEEAHEWNNGTCSECEYVCLHTSVAVTKKDGQGATCTVDGWKDYYQCACGKYFADEARTTPISDLETWKANDGKILTNHEYGNLIPEESAVHTQTELKAGMKVHYKCSVCQGYFDENKNPTTENALIIPKPEHSYGDWVKDNEKHWKVCSCGLKSSENTHQYDDNSDMICNDCGWDRTVQHTHGNGTKQDGQGATCTVNGWKDYYKCSCGKIYTDAACTNEITSFEEWKNGDGKIAAVHSYGDLIAKVDATCSATGMQAHFECSVCHTLFDADKAVKTENELTIAIDANAHTYGAWTSNGDGTHTRVCSLNAEHKENGNCAGGTATCIEKAVCATCNTAYGNTTDEHSYGAWTSNGDGTHTRVCSLNAEHKENGNCAGGTATCTEKAVCTTCNTAYGNIAAHTDSDSNGKCDACEYQMSTTPNNPNNTPDNPNNTPDDPREDKDGLGAGAIVGIVIGSVAVAGTGGFALFWFVIKKKSFADLKGSVKKLFRKKKSLGSEPDSTDNNA